MIDPEGEVQRVVGVGRATARRLVAAGYTTIEALARASPEELEEVLGARASEIIVAARERLREVKEVERVVKVAEERKEVIIMAELEKEQGPILDLIDKISDKDSSLHIEIEDVGGRVFGRSLRLMGKVRFDLGTLKKAK